MPLLNWHYEATYESIRFVETSGDSIYLDYVIGSSLKVWKERWLLFFDSGGCYIADTQTLSISRIGNEGNGPGEYRRPSRISVRGDTAIVTHDGLQASEFLLPGGEFIGRVNPVTWAHLLIHYWESDTQFYSRYHGLYVKPEGVFGRFSRDGELIQEFGKFDAMERYDGSLTLQNTMNSGSLRPTPTGDLAFLYNCRQLLLIFSPTGELKQEIALDMPWNYEQDPNPYGSQRTGFATRTLTMSMQVIEDGFLVACKGIARRGSLAHNIVAVYSWNGTLNRVIHFPPTPGNYPLEDYIHGAVQVQGEIWVALYGDPAFRKLRIVERHQDN